MDIPYMRNELLSYKDFFHFLYINNPRKNKLKLQRASEKQLKTLIKICHLISNGSISLRKKDFDALKISRRLNLFENLFHKRDSLLSLLSATRDVKIKELKKLAAVFRHLFYTMFNTD